MNFKALLQVLCLLFGNLISADNVSSQDNVNVTLPGTNSAYSAEDLLLALERFHYPYCGNMTQCNDDNPQEPSPNLYPVPCCVPCSCLPECRIFHNCCPSYLTQLQDTKESQTGKSIEEVSEHNGYNERNQKVEGSRIIHRNDRKFTQKAKDSKIEKVNPIESAVNDIVINSTRYSCARPQLTYAPNSNVDSIAYEMVGSCPDEEVETSEGRKCLSGFENDDFYDSIPVTSIKSGITYKNRQCFICNENEAPSRESVYAWKPVLKLMSAWYWHDYFESPQDFKSYAIRHNNIHFLPPTVAVTRPCQHYDIASCNQTGLWETFDDLTVNVCELGQSLPILQTVSDNRRLFKNIACLFCNIPEHSLENYLSCGYYSGFRNQGFDLYINIIDSRPQNGDSLASSYIDETTVKQLRNKLCPEGYVDILVHWHKNTFSGEQINGSIFFKLDVCKNDDPRLTFALFDAKGLCRKIHCPRDHYMVEKRCIPLYDSLSRLSLHFKLIIRPKSTVGKSLWPDFTNRIQHIVNDSMKKTFKWLEYNTLLSVFPRSQTNPIEYFCFGIYLASPADYLEYSKSLLDMFNLFKILRSQQVITLTNGLRFRLEYKFGHRVDTKLRQWKDNEGGQPLIPITKWTNPRPHMTISDTNWCYRVYLMAEELQGLSRLAIQVKQTKTLVYQDQYDKRFSQYLVCIDIFGPHTDKSLDRKTNTTQISVVVGDFVDAIPWYMSRSAIITGSLVAAFVIGVSFYKIQRCVAKPRSN